MVLPWRVRTESSDWMGRAGEHLTIDESISFGVAANHNGIATS